MTEEVAETMAATSVNGSGCDDDRDKRRWQWGEGDGGGIDSGRGERGGLKVMSLGWRRWQEQCDNDGGFA